MTVKTSPLCSRDNGRVIFFTAKVDVQKHRITVPRELLDEACGDTSTEADRKAWVSENLDNCLAQIQESTVRKPFDRIRVEEIS